MPVLTVRISDGEKKLLARRAARAGLSSGALVRQMLQEEPLVSAAELLGEMNRRLGDAKLRIKRRR
jgi:Ribbon-helix-helix protein, copG family